METLVVHWRATKRLKLNKIFLRLICPPFHVLIEYCCAAERELNRLMDELYEHESLNNDEDENSQDLPTSFNKPKPMPIK